MKFDPDYVVSPGKTIEENIAFLGMTKANFARHMGIPIGTLHRLISSEIPLSVDFALKLEYVTKVPAAFWNSLETCKPALKWQKAFSLSKLGSFFLF